MSLLVIVPTLKRLQAGLEFVTVRVCKSNMGVGVAEVERHRVGTFTYRKSTFGRSALVRSARNWTARNEAKAVFGLKPMQMTPTFLQFAVCINNTGYPASLELHKIYRVVPDADATQDGDLRIIDESGEDYLYPAAYFVGITMPQVVEQSLLRAA